MSLEEENFELFGNDMIQVFNHTFSIDVSHIYYFFNTLILCYIVFL